MKIVKKSLIFCLFLLLIAFSLQPFKTFSAYSDGTLDTSFNIGTGFLNGLSQSEVYVIAIQPDGKILVGGEFTFYNETARERIVRLNSDGTIDASFNPGTGADGLINSIVIQADNKILIGGNFTSYNGTSRSNIARLNSDGSLDNSFVSGCDDLGINSIVIQADNKILIGGAFTTYDGESRKHIARLNSNGSLDATFDPVLGTGGLFSYINSIAVQGDDKILIGGNFTSYNGIGRNHIARLSFDGSLDATFDPGTGFNSEVFSIVQSDNKILLAGSFSSYNGTGVTGVARINSNGTLDNSFVADFSTSSVIPIVIQGDGKILIGSDTISYNGTTINRIARLNSDGSLDTSFNSGSGFDRTVRSISLDSDNKILVGGWFTSYNGILRNRIVRIGFDSTSPVLSQITPVESSSTDQTPTYTFSTDEAGTITYGGSCTSVTTNATVGNNTITFNELEPGTYSNCTITVTDSSLNVSDILTISSFTIERRSSSGSYTGGFRRITNTNVPITSNTIIPTTTLDTQTPTITTNTNNKYISPIDNKELSCNPFNFYLRKNNKNNNINEVKLWQAFLNKYENETLKIDGIYGSKTEQAINNFQLKYKENILTPWNITMPTGYVYKSTRAHGNKLLGCSEGEVMLDNGIKVNF